MRYKANVDTKRLGESTKGLSSALNSSREIHPLASAESNLELAVAYCNRCKTMMEKSYSSENIIRQQELAIGYTGEAIESVRNYQLNPTRSAAMSTGYILLVKDLLAPLSKVLGPYREGKNVRSLLKDFVDKYGERANPGQASLVMQTFELLQRYDAPEKLQEFLKAKGLEQMVSIVQGLDKDKLAQELRKKSKDIRNTNRKEEQALDYIKNAIQSCSTKCGYQQECDGEEGTRVLLPKAQKLVTRLREESLVLSKDTASSLSLVFDIVAGLVENIDKDEVEMLKFLALGQFKKSDGFDKGPRRDSDIN
ncbi:hypothetical protein HZA33_00725 [Candidatus Pacearchaeota archaeon]|nr:hypothetical protein [Candidatus Pacearchaeota archaeon]